MRAYEIQFSDEFWMRFIALTLIFGAGFYWAGLHVSARLKEKHRPRSQGNKSRVKGKPNSRFAPYGFLLVGVPMFISGFLILEEPHLRFTRAKYDDKSIAIQRPWPWSEQKISLNSVELIYLKRETTRSRVVIAMMVIRLQDGKEWISTGRTWREFEPDYSALQSRFIQWKSEGLLEKVIPVID